MYRLEPQEFYDQFIIGVVHSGETGEPVIAYDEDALIEALTKNIREDSPEMSEEDAALEAREHFDFNIDAGSAFKGGPVFVSKQQWQVVLEEEGSE